MEGYNKKLGAFGEKIAESFLLKRSYQIINKNYYTSSGEIDLIVKKNRELIFIEVKTRTNNSFGLPENAVDYRKLQHLHKAISIFFEQSNIRLPWQIDIISVEIDKVKKTAIIKHFKNIQ